MSRLPSVSHTLERNRIRKVIGGGKKEIVQQFLIENTVLCALLLVSERLSPLLSLLLDQFAVTLFLFHSSFPLTERCLPSLAAHIVLVPLYRERTRPLCFIVRPGEDPSRKRKIWQQKSVKQISIKLSVRSFISRLFVACLVFINSSHYFEKKDWGYDHDQHIFTSVKNVEQYKGLKDLVAQNRNVISLAGAESHIGHNVHYTTVNVGTSR
jgi:hypothetical protein